MRFLSKECIFTFVSLLTLLNAAVAQGFDAESESDNKSRLINGLANNDKLAFEEASKLPVEQGAPLLLVYVDDATTNRERAEKAREILRSMPGFSEYMKQRLLEKRNQPGGEYNMKEFRLLKAIGGDEAAAAVAPFLFVDDKPLIVSDHHSAGPIKYDALNALVGMHLTDGPPDKRYPGFTKPDIEEWKAWAVKKGYKDSSIPSLITLQEKGVPPNVIRRSEALLASAKSAPPATAPPLPSSASQSTPMPATLKATPAQAVVNEPQSTRGFPIVPVVILVAAIVALMVFLLRRKSP